MKTMDLAFITNEEHDLSSIKEILEEEGQSSVQQIDF